MKNQLPWVNPFITSFPQHANLFAIICNNPNALPWIYNHYIQLRINKHPTQASYLDFCTGDNWEMIRRCPFLEVFSESITRIEKDYYSISEYITKSVDLGLYVILPIDWYYISISDSYMKYHQNHDLLCFGYDNDLSIFNIADFLIHQKYAQYTCSFDELERSYSNVDFTEYCIINSVYSMRLIPNQSYNFNIGLFKTLLIDYINSENSNKHFYPIKSEDFIDDQSFTYGISIYEELICLLTYRSNLNMEVPIRTFHVLYDHKQVLKEAYLYLYKQGYIIVDDIFSSIKELVNLSYIIRNLIIKYNFKPDIKTIKNCISKLLDMKNIECTAIQELIKHIHDNPILNIELGSQISIHDYLCQKSSANNMYNYTLLFAGTEIAIPIEFIKHIDKLLIDQKQYVVDTKNNRCFCGDSYHILELCLKTNVFDNIFLTNYTDNLSAQLNFAYYIGTDYETLGNWIGSYGSKGFDITGIASNCFSKNVTFMTNNINRKIWNVDTTLPKALLHPNSQKRIASCMYVSQKGFFEFLILGNSEIKLSLYVMDWFNFNRLFSVSIIDADLHKEIVNVDIDCKNTGIYYSFYVKGHIIISIHNKSEPIATISGIFYD